ncbi:hypothetical protein ACV36O_29900, partial [Pseudomonas aeruginosa]
RWRHLRSWLFGEPERFRDERQRLWGAYAAWLGEQVQQRLGEDAETAPRLLAFLESRRGFGVFAQALLDLLTEPCGIGAPEPLAFVAEPLGLAEQPAAQVP